MNVDTTWIAHIDEHWTDIKPGSPRITVFKGSDDPGRITVRVNYEGDNRDHQVSFEPELAAHVATAILQLVGRR